MKTSPLATKAETAAAIGISPGSLDRLRKQGVVSPAVRIGGILRFDPAECLAAIRRHSDKINPRWMRAESFDSLHFVTGTDSLCGLRLIDGEAWEPAGESPRARCPMCVAELRRG